MSAAVEVEAVVFDLDGVLIESEQVWDEVREEFVQERGGRWHEGAQREMMGMSSTEWSRYMSEQLRVPLPAERVSSEVAARVGDVYRRDLPLLPGAVEAVMRLERSWHLGLASSSNRPIIDLVLELARIAGCFSVTVSSEEVGRGKPAPDVYLEAARRLQVDARRVAAIEDSTNGLRSAREAGLAVIAIPNRAFAPRQDAVAAAHVVLGSLDELTTDAVEAAVARRSAAPSG